MQLSLLPAPPRRWRGPGAPTGGRPGRHDVGGGRRLTATEIAAESGASVWLVYFRLRAGWKGADLLRPARDQVKTGAVTVEQVLAMRAKGMTVRAIAHELGCARITVKRRIRQARDKG